MVTVRKYIVTKEQIKKVLGITEDEYIELIEGLEEDLKVKNKNVICLKISVEDVVQ